jgi:predicted DsbA family dithiol-disulfide isomerase
LADNAIVPEVLVTEFTDPGCPWAYSAEPFRRRLDWLYGEAIGWETRMVVLAETPQEYLDKGFTPEKQAAAFRTIAREHGMPIDTAQRPRMAATLPACQAVVATRLNAPELVSPLLRCLRVLNFDGSALLDEPAMLEQAAVGAGIQLSQLEGWLGDARVREALHGDMAAARKPSRAGRALDHKLANWSGGRRYTCPSYEITRISDGVTITVPGFQPFAVYDVVLANLLPGLDRRSESPDVETVLRWARTPLATREVAVLAEIDHAEARERLGRVAVERHVGSDGFWTLADPPVSGGGPFAPIAPV